MLKLLVVAAPAEVDRLAAAAAAMGGLAVGAGDPEDFAQAVVSVRPDAVVLADGGALADPLAAVRRVRALAGGQTPVVFVGEAPAASQVEGFVDAAFRRPLDARALVSRAAELSVREAPPLDQERLSRLAEELDDTLAAELARALAPEPGAVPGAAMDVATGLEISWRELVGVEEDDAAPEPWHGDLIDVDLPMLLGRLHGAGLTGRLLVTAGPERAIWFEAGRPVLASSAEPADRMADMLVRRRRLTPAQRETAGRAADQSGRRMGALLVDLGFLPPGELLPVVRAHFEELVLSLFHLAAGPWRFEVGALASPSEVRFLRHPAALVRQGLSAAQAHDRLWQRLGSPRNVFALETGAGAAELLAEIAPDPAERRVLLLCDGVRSLEEVIRLAATPSAESVLYCAWAFSLLRPAGDLGLPARDGELLRERLRLRHELALDGDYFQVLGVSRRATVEEIEHAHQRLGQDLALAASQPELAELLSTLREVADEARLILTSPSLRGPYQAALPPARRGVE